MVNSTRILLRVLSSNQVHSYVTPLIAEIHLQLSLVINQILRHSREPRCILGRTRMTFRGHQSSCPFPSKRWSHVLLLAVARLRLPPWMRPHPRWLQMTHALPMEQIAHSMPSSVMLPVIMPQWVLGLGQNSM